MTSQSGGANTQRSQANSAMLETAFLYGGNAAYIEQLYAQYSESPSSVSSDWRAFFDEVGDPAEVRRAGSPQRNYFRPGREKPASYFVGPRPWPSHPSSP